MSATNQELEKALISNMPTHNVYYEWEKDEEAIIKACEEKGIPVPPGKRPKLAVPAMARELRW
jgi:hypothetical protein